jgi:chitosanase
MRLVGRFVAGCWRIALRALCLCEAAFMIRCSPEKRLPKLHNETAREGPSRRLFLELSGAAMLLGMVQPSASHAAPPAMSDIGNRTPVDRSMARRVKAISNVFEVGRVTPDYAYVEALGDGRGLTLTQYGLVTNELEVGWVIEKHFARTPHTKLVRFLPALPPHGTGTDLNQLHGFADIWRAEIADGASLIAACDEVADSLYFQPAVHAFDLAKLASPVGLLIFYDTLLQHGGGDDPDSFGAILGRSQARLVQSKLLSETARLKSFLAERRAVLLNPHNVVTAEVWRRSATRVDALETLLSRNPLLRPPVIVANSEIRVRVS